MHFVVELRRLCSIGCFGRFLHAYFMLIWLRLPSIMQISQRLLSIMQIRPRLLSIMQMSLTFDPLTFDLSPISYVFLYFNVPRV